MSQKQYKQRWKIESGVTVGESKHTDKCLSRFRASETETRRK